MPPSEVGRLTLEYIQRLESRTTGRMVLDLGAARFRSESPARLRYLEHLQSIETAVSSAYGEVCREDPRFPLIVIR